MKLRDLILNNMPTNLNNLEKARYIYLKLAFILNFSTKYQNTSDLEFAKMFTSKSGIDELTYNQVICKNWAQIYSSLLNDVGIKNYVIDQGHSYVLFEYEGKLWVADSTAGEQTDLSRIRYGENTEYFGMAVSQDLDKPRNTIVFNQENNELLEKIDKNFDFYYERKINNKKIKNELMKIKNSNMTISEKLEFMFQILGVLLDGFYEAKDFVKGLEFEFLTKEEISCVKGVDLKRTNNNGEVDIVQCIIINENDKYNYYLLSPRLPITKVTKEEIIKLSMLGYGIGEKKIPGIDYPRNFKAGDIDRIPLKYKIIKNFLPKKILRYDEEQIKKIG